MNGYKRAQPFQSAPDDPSRGTPSGVAGGYRGDIPPHGAPLDTSPSMEAIRFESGAIRKDFGFRRVGLAASSRVLAIVEHKFIVEGEKFERLVRLYRDGSGKLALEVLTSGAWQLIDTSAESVEDVYLSTLSIQGVLLIADGKHLWKWSESIETDLHEDDFPAANALADVGDTALATLTGVPLNTSVKIGLAASVTGTSSGGITAVVGVERNGVEISEKVFVADPDLTPGATQSWSDQQLTYDVPGLSTGDEIVLHLKSVTTTGGSEHVHDTSATQTVVKTANGAIDDTHLISFDLSVSPETAPGDGVEVELLYSTTGAGPWTSVDTRVFDAGVGDTSYLNQSFEAIVAGMSIGSAFKLDVSTINANLTVGTISNLAVDYDALQITPTAVEIHGLNKTVDVDAFAGIETSEAVDNVSTLEVIAGAPAARLIYAMGDYAVALHNAGDTQTFSWSVNGNVADWTSVDSGQIFLVMADSDPIDDLSGFASIGSGIGALFRKRSVMRAILTGNVAQSIGAIKWIEENGTESPFSIQKVLGGVMYLGFDQQVYFLTESGTTGVGDPIHMDLVRSLTSKQDLVDSAYDSVFHEYILGIPENGSSIITRVWYFDVRAYLSEQRLVWRTRSLSVQRFGQASTV